MFPGQSLQQIVGLAGVAFYIGSYLALQLGLVAGQSYIYALLNIAAAACVLVSLLDAFNLSSALIQVTWITISLVGITRLFVGHHMARFSADEHRFLASKLPGLPRDLARRFLAGGVWTVGGPDDVLTVEAQPNRHLVYLLEGAALVLVGGRTVGRTGGDVFIGELTCLKGQPATATVVLDAPSRFFAIGTARLRQLVRRHPELRAALEASFAEDARQKLMQSNRVAWARAQATAVTPERGAAAIALASVAGSGEKADD